MLEVTCVPAIMEETLIREYTVNLPTHCLVFLSPGLWPRKKGKSCGWLTNSQHTTLPRERLVTWRLCAGYNLFPGRRAISCRPDVRYWCYWPQCTMYRHPEGRTLEPTIVELNVTSFPARWLMSVDRQHHLCWGRVDDGRQLFRENDCGCWLSPSSQSFPLEVV